MPTTARSAQQGGRFERSWRGPDLGRLVLALVLVLGCEARFVDPHPPELSLLSREQTLKVVDAPVVYGLLFDLHLPDATECTRIKSRLTERFRAVMLPAGRQGLELAAQDLSPGCRQLSSRQVSLGVYEQQLSVAESRFGAGRVKPVLLYFNNVELPPPATLQSSFYSLRLRTVGAPLLWALSTPESIQGINFEQKTPWTYSADPSLTAALEQVARTQLPLVQLEQSPAEGFPLFSTEELTWVREFKGCTRLSTLSGANFTYGPQAIRVDKARPPRIRVAPAGPQQGPAPRDGKLQPQVVRFELEVCRAHCERLYDTPPDGTLLVWNTTTGCLLKNVP